MRGWCSWIGILFLVLCSVVGCSETPEQKKAAEEAKKSTEVTLGDAASEFPDEDDAAPKPRTDQDSVEIGKTKELKLPKSGLRFDVPPAWSKTTSGQNFYDAEFSIPKIKPDEAKDGRLTMLHAQQPIEDTIKNWEEEFDSGTRRDSKDETLTIAGRKVTLIDRHGDWLGTRYRREEQPLKNFRLLAAIVPVTETHSCFIRFLGPDATITAGEKDFRNFVNSVKPLDEKK